MTTPRWKLLKEMPRVDVDNDILNYYAIRTAPVDLFGIIVSLDVELWQTPSQSIKYSKLVVENEKPRIYIQKEAPLQKVRYSAAYDLGDLIIKGSGHGFLRNISLNLFAQELLLPSWLIGAYFYAASHHMNNMTQAAEIFGVPEDIMKKRQKFLGYPVDY